MIGRRVFASAVGVFLCTTSLAQTASWTTAHYDSLLVAPRARNVTYKTGTVMRYDGPAEQDELRYTVEEPYPASEFLDHLYSDLRQKGWEPGTNRDRLENWITIPTQSRAEHAWVMQWQNGHHEFVSYSLKYTNAENEHYLRTLHVDAYFGGATRSQAESDRPKTAPEYKNYQPSLKSRLIMFAILLIYVLVLVGITWFVARSTVRSAVFYGGPKAWLGWINLVLFAPIVVSFLSLGSILVTACFPVRGDVAGAVMVAAIGGWMILALCSKAGYVAIPIVLLLAASILLSKNIPGKAKIAHAVLDVLTVAYFVVCIVYFSGPLIRW